MISKTDLGNQILTVTTAATPSQQEKLQDVREECIDGAGAFCLRVSSGFEYSQEFSLLSVNSEEKAEMGP